MRKMSEIASKISEISGDTKKASREFLNAFIETVINGLINDGEVEVEKLGYFGVRTRRPVLGRNPKTGEKVQVPELKSIYFKPCKEFKQKVNK